MDPNRGYRVNERIRTPQVRVISPDGDMLGIMPIQAALAEAEQRGLDLIEVAPEAKPPVCRIIDYGKFRYEQRKKLKEAQKKSKQNEIKGIRVRPNTDDHDLDFKSRNALRFLRKGDKVKFTVIFRGPELRHKEIGTQQLQRFIERLKDYALVDQPPRMEGRRMTMLLEPRKDMPAEKPEERALAAADAARLAAEEAALAAELAAEPEEESPAEAEASVAESEEGVATSAQDEDAQVRDEANESDEQRASADAEPEAESPAE